MNDEFIHEYKYKGISFTVVVDPYRNAIYQPLGNEMYHVNTSMWSPYGKFLAASEINKDIFGTKEFKEYWIPIFAKDCYDQFVKTPINEKISQVER